MCCACGLGCESNYIYQTIQLTDDQNNNLFFFEFQTNNIIKKEREIWFLSDQQVSSRLATCGKKLLFAISVWKHKQSWPVYNLICLTSVITK